MSRYDKREDMVEHGQDPYNAEPPLAGLHDPLTGVRSFYSRNHGPVLDVDADRWRLQVDGLVERSLSLSLRELQDGFRVRRLVATLQCAGNRRAGLLAVRDIPGEDPWRSGAISTAEWSGVALADVLAAAGVGPDAAHVAFSAPDHCTHAQPPQAYGGSIDLAKACSDEVLLAWQMDGEPLSPLHGAPVRVVVPGYIGARSVKWVDHVSVQAQASTNYFQAIAYRMLPADADPDAAVPGAGIELSSMALTSAILSPTPGQRLDAGPVAVTGYAVAGDARRVERVDVSIDGGRSWVQAEVAAPVSPWAWQHWRTTVQLPPGVTTIVTRAWDSAATVQPESAAQVWNPKGYVNNSWDRVDVTG